MSTARWNLKEAGGKPPARGPRTPGEASGSWMSLQHKAKSLLPKAAKSKWGGEMEGKTELLPGEACRTGQDTGNPGREARLNRQESAEGIVPGGS